MNSHYTDNAATVKILQAKLNARFGFRLAVDGIWGRNTMAAVAAVKQRHNLMANAYVGPVTWKLITQGKAKPKTPARLLEPRIEELPELPWMQELLKVHGLNEHDLRAKEWLKSDGDLRYNIENTPWCGEGVATALNLGLGIKKAAVPPNGDHWGTINWLKWGIPVSPQFGAIMIFWREKPTSWKGHIGFYWGEDATHYHILGTNQSDAINIKRLHKSRLRSNGARWPANYKKPTNVVVNRSSRNVGVTVNEV